MNPLFTKWLKTGDTIAFGLRFLLAAFLFLLEIAKCRELYGSFLDAWANGVAAGIITSIGLSIPLDVIIITGIYLRRSYATFKNTNGERL